MSDLVLLRPLWLLTLLPLLGVLWWLRRRPTRGWAAIIDPALMPALRRLGLMTEGGGNVQHLLPVLAGAVMVIALSGPAAQRPGAIEFRALDPMILVLDLSPSVVADQKVLGQLQSSAMEILTASAGRPVGMMVYAADAYLASAPTTDAMGLQGLLAVLEQGTVPIEGSRPDIALSMARDLFSGKGAGIGGADLVLISDGGGSGPRADEEAARLATDGARVWTLALPENATGAPEPSLQGLRQIAEAGKGAMFEVSQVPQLMSRVASARTARLAREETASLGLRDYGPWLLPFAMLILFPLFRRQR